MLLSIAEFIHYTTSSIMVAKVTMAVCIISVIIIIKRMLLRRLHTARFVVLLFPDLISPTAMVIILVAVLLLINNVGVHTAVVSFFFAIKLLLLRVARFGDRRGEFSPREYREYIRHR